MTEFLYDIPKNIDEITSYPPYFYNLVMLSCDLTEEQIFKLRFNINPDDTLKYIYKHECRYNKPLLKVGFISRDFSEGRPSGQLAFVFFQLIRDAFKKFDVEVFIYSFRTTVSNRFRQFATIRQNNNIYRLGSMIFDDKIDILVDMQGHMHNNFNNMLKQKPAPIIIHWLGYPGTMGLKCIDYHIADRIVIPHESTKYYTEKIAYFDNCYQVNNPTLLVTDSIHTRETFEYPKDKFLFCHFNSDYKLDKHTWSIWLKILKLVPNSALVYCSSDKKVKEKLLAVAEEHGIGSDRIILTKRLTRYHHMNRIATLNCGLDTYYCNGHTTTSDLIAGGIPVVTLPGNTYHSRVSKSILLSLDLPELIASTWDEYVDISVRLATDSVFYKSVKDKIMENRSKILYNTELYTNNFVKLLLNIWRNHNGTVLPDGVEMMEVTQFGHHRRDQNYKWVFYPKMDSPGGNIETVEYRYQELRDYADSETECVAFNTNGEIKSEVYVEKLVPLIGDSENNDGIWIKEYYTA